MIPRVLPTNPHSRDHRIISSIRADADVAEERVEQIVTLEVPRGYEEGTRLDLYLSRFLPNVSRTKVQRGIKEGYVRVNDEVVDKPSYSVQPQDVIVCKILRPPPIEAQPEPIPLEIVFEDDDLIIVNKPAGMVVHPAYGHRSGTLVNALLHHVGSPGLALEPEDGDALDDEALYDEDVGLSTIRAVPEVGGDPAMRPGIVHRLDKDTSGLLVVAKNDHAHRELARQFAERTIERRYLAVLWGVPDPPTGRIATEIGRDPRDRKRMAVVAEGSGKTAVTHYELIEPLSYASLCAFRLETGRTHQIRVHAQHIHHPVFGDEAYGGRAIRYGPATGSRKAFIRNLFDHLNRQALHAETLGLVHPGTGERVSFQVDPPGDMQHVIDRLRTVEG